MASTKFLPEIGFDDLRVVAHRVGHSFGDAPAGTEHGHPVADIHDEADDMLYENERDALFIADAPEQGIEFGEAIEAEADGRLVEQHDLRVANESSGDLDDPLLPEGEGGTRTVGECRHADEFQRLTGRFFRDLLLPVAAQVEAGGDEARRGAVMQSRHEVFQHRHAAKQLRGLEGAAEPEPRDGARLAPDDGHAIEQHVALVRGVNAGDDVEHRRLARPVGADQAADLAGLDIEVDAVEHLHAAETVASRRLLVLSGQRTTPQLAPKVTAMQAAKLSKGPVAKPAGFDDGRYSSNATLGNYRPFRYRSGTNRAVPPGTKRTRKAWRL